MIKRNSEWGKIYLFHAFLRPEGSGYFNYWTKSLNCNQRGEFVKGKYFYKTLQIT